MPLVGFTILLDKCHINGMSSLLASLLKDSLSEQPSLPAAQEEGEAHQKGKTQQPVGNDEDDAASEDDEATAGREQESLAPSLQSALRLIASNPHLILHAGEDGTPNIFFALHSLLVTEAILQHYPELARATRPGRGDTPLHASCQVPSVAVETIRLLLSHAPETALAKNNDGKLPLHLAAANATVSSQVLTVVHLAHPDGVTSLERKNDSLPLHYACAFKAPLANVETLLRLHPAALRVRDRQGNLPLHLALLYKSEADVVECLLQAWPESIAEPDGKARLPLHLSTIASHDTAVIAAILARRPEAAGVAVDGKKPIHYAIRQKGRVETIRLLLAASNSLGTDISTAGDTLLHSALEFSAPLEVVQAIIDTDPRAIHECNADGKLPLHFAAWHQSDHAILALLLAAHPAYVQTKEARGGNLPLHYAIQYAPQGPQADVRPALLLLSAYPAAAFEPNAKGYYPIHLAAKNRCPMRLLDALLAIAPYSVGFEDRDPNSRLLPLDFALLAGASTPGFDTVSRLLGVDLRLPPARGGKASRQESPSPNPSQGQGQGESATKKAQPPGTGPQSQQTSPPPRAAAAIAATAPATAGTTPGKAPSSPEPCDHAEPAPHHQVGVKEALLELQRQYRDQGEEMRLLRKKHQEQTARLQALVLEGRGLRHDLSWRDDRIRILEREVDIQRKELESHK